MRATMQFSDLPIADTGERSWGRPVYVTTRPIVYRVRTRALELTVRVPAGFCTDLASVPWPLHLLPSLHPNGAWALAAILHDYLCLSHEVTRTDADYVFLRVMTDHHVRLRWVAYLAVRGYWIAWRQWRISRDPRAIV